MKRFFCLTMVFVSLFALVSCDSKEKEKPLFEEEVSKEISAEEGGTVESSDGKTSIEIPGGALESDTTITMRIYDPAGYAGTEGKKVISKVVEFEPTGTVFRKPVTISMAGTESIGLRAITQKVVTAAVYREEKGEWSYSETGVAVKMSRDASGDPIMTTASGDPIMLNAAGDPIMQSDGSMLSAAGDPIMVSAAGDPIMQTAAGDPIMMTTGHFTAYAFFVTDVEKEEPAEDSDDSDDIEDIDDTDTDEPDDDTDTAEPDDDTDTDVPEPEPPYSKALCTNLTVCTNDEGYQIVCPAEDDEFYGQDAQYVAKRSCVPHKTYTNIPKPEMLENDFVEIRDDATGITWLFTGIKGTFEDLKDGCDISYDGKEDWRLPTPKELLSLTDRNLGMSSRGFSLDPLYFGSILNDEGADSYFGTYIWSSVESYFYSSNFGELMPPDYYTNYMSYFTDGMLVCVSGREYGKVKAANYVSVIEEEAETVFDSSMNLHWMKDYIPVQTWQEALEYCENLEFSGYTDWRLPNINELMTLVDFSKAGTGLLSSFPGMKPDAFWSSTGGSYGPLIVYMADGIPGDINSFSSAVVNKNIRRDGEEEEEHTPVLAALCVRSYLDEKTDEPACGESGAAPCKDKNGTVWSSVINLEKFYDFDQSNIYSGGGDYYYGSNPKYGYGYGSSEPYVYWDNIIGVCNTLTENGSQKWRLPTIDELRATAVTGKIKKGGTCGITNDCRDMSCYDAEACSGDEPSHTLLYDYGMMLSGTLTLDYYDEETESSPELWALNTENGAVATVPYEFPIKTLVLRCVYDETIEYVTAPYTDPETGLLWSEAAYGWMNLADAENYCFSLSKEDNENWWRLPTIEEMWTLVRNCSEEDEYCGVDLNGGHSIFRDTDYFWALNGEQPYYISFTDVYVSTTGNNDWNRTRCVSDSPNPCAADPCASLQHSDGTCMPESAEKFSCGCEGDYLWNGSNCVNTCEGNPCASLQHSDGVCVSESAEEFSCGCEEHYWWDEDETACKPDTQDVECDGLPENAEWTGSGFVTQTWEDGGWYPSNSAVYNEAPDSGECSFKCKGDFQWVDGDCVEIPVAG